MSEPRRPAAFRVEPEGAVPEQERAKPGREPEPARELAVLPRPASVAKIRRRALDAIARDDAKAARAVVAELTSFVAGKPETAAGRRALADLRDEIIDGANLVRLAEAEILVPLD